MIDGARAFVGVALLGAAAIAAPAPIALWNFEDGAGAGIAAGSSASFALEGEIGDGLLTEMVADDIAGFGGTDPFTIFATFQLDPTSANTNNTIFGYSPNGGSGAGTEIRLMVQTDGQIRGEASSGAGSEFTPSVDILDGQPHTIAMIVSGGENFNDIDIYLDGEMILNPFSAGNNAPMDLTGMGRAIEIGQDRPGVIGGNRTFDGLIDDVALFGSALTVSELDGLRASGVIPEPTALAIASVLAAAGCARQRSRG